MAPSMKRITLMFAASAALCGCASVYEDSGTSPGPSMSASIQQAIGDRYAGRPVADMLARYGAPEQRMPQGAETIYTWRRTETVYYSTQAPLVATCQLDAYVQRDLTVRTIGLNGQNAGCPGFQP